MHHFAYRQMVAHCADNVFIKQGGLHAHGGQPAGQIETVVLPQGQHSVIILPKTP